MHKKILELIENVDPNDADTLDEIDARVWCWLRGCKFAGNRRDRIFIIDENQCEIEKLNGLCTLKYTRSRDALKAIRPEEYFFRIDVGVNGKTDVMFGVAFDLDRYGSTMGVRGETDVLPTEELAELHAIIQAIAYERTSDRKPV